MQFFCKTMENVIKHSKIKVVQTDRISIEYLPNWLLGNLLAI